MEEDAQRSLEALDSALESSSSESVAWIRLIARNRRVDLDKTAGTYCEWFAAPNKQTGNHDKANEDLCSRHFPEFLR